MQAFLPLFQHQTIMVFGDIIADLYEYGIIRRLSREAPIPIVEFEQEKMVLGGAGNVIANITSLGGKAIPVSVIGQDQPSDQLLELFKTMQIETKGILRSSKLVTPIKRRILAQGEQSIRQQILRLDRLPQQPLGPADLAELWDRAVALIDQVQAVIISDYISDKHHHWLPPQLLTDLIKLAGEKGKTIVSDSRHRIAQFKGVTLLTPNRAEAAELVGRELRTTADLKQAGKMILDQTEAQLLLITLGDQGMALFQQNQELELIPAHNKQEVFDVSGAGDTVVAAITLGLLAGMSPLEAARFANIAAGLVIRKIGTATISVAEIGAELEITKT